MAVLKDLIVHGASRFINVIQFTSTKGGVIAADKGVFNKLIATSGEIGTLDVEELNADTLTAQNATVMGLLDVRGDLHTNSWTNSNIATIAGNFYIAPTVVSSINANVDNGVELTKTGTYWTMIVSRPSGVSSSQPVFVVPNLEATEMSSEDTSYNSWSQNSLVMVTGSIKKNGITYPLGTLKGKLYQIDADGATITDITDNLGNDPTTLNEYGAGTFGIVEIKISLYQRAYNTIEDNNTVTFLYPLGILMSAQGRASKSFIDIYNGANILQTGNLDPETGTTTSDYGGLAIPTVRIGNLRGLPNILSGGFTNEDGGLPTGWGIYTDNGYFKGTIVATSGNIGGAEIINNTLKVTDANIVSLSATKIQDVETLSALSADMGVLTAGRIQGGNPSESGFMFIAPEDYSSAIYELTEDTTYDSTKTYYILNQNNEYEEFTGSAFESGVNYYELIAPAETIQINDGDKSDWRLILGANFGVDKNGMLYANNVRLQGEITASEFKVETNGITYISNDSQGIHIGDSNGFHLLINDNGINFYSKTIPMAYINNNAWFTSTANVLQDLKIGYPTNASIPSGGTGKGQWAWAIHTIGSSTQNNLYLKWMG